MMRLALVVVLSGALLGTACRRAAKPEPAEKAPPKAKAPAAAGVVPQTEPEPAAPVEQPAAEKPKPALPAEAPEKGKAAQAEPQPAPVPQTRPPVERKDVRTPIVRALLGALDDIRGIDDEQKEGLAQSLLAADCELSQVLGDNSRRLILKANQKPPMLIVGEPGPLPPPAPVPPPGPVPPPAPAPSAQAMPPLPPPASREEIIQSLLKTVDQLEGESPEAKEALKKAILDADKRLNNAGK